MTKMKSLTAHLLMVSVASYAFFGTISEAYTRDVAKPTQIPSIQQAIDADFSHLRQFRVIL